MRAKARSPFTLLVPSQRRGCSASLTVVFIPAHTHSVEVQSSPGRRIPLTGGRSRLTESGNSSLEAQLLVSGHFGVAVSAWWARTCRRDDCNKRRVKRRPSLSRNTGEAGVPTKLLHKLPFSFQDLDLELLTQRRGGGQTPGVHSTSKMKLANMSGSTGL